MRAARPTSVAAAVLLSVLVAGCRPKPNSDAPAPPAAALGPVQAPDGLLAEVVLGTPDATWQRAQRGLGGGAGILPSTLGGMLCALSGVDAGLAQEVDGTRPAYAVVAGAPSAPAWVVAARLVEERRARSLFEGEAARFDARDGGVGVTLLAPKGRSPVAPQGRADGVEGARPSPVAALVAGGWFVVGSSAAELARLAPYATRTLASRPPPSESLGVDLPPAALGELAADAQRRWAASQQKMVDDDAALRAAHGGRAPDYGDPRAIVQALDAWVQAKVALLRDLGGAHVAIDVGDGDVRATLAAQPSSAGGAAATLLGKLHPAELAPLLALPRDTALAVFVSDAAEERVSDAARAEATLAATLGPRLTSTEQARLHAALDHWTRARGDWMTLAFVYGADGRGLLGDVSASDATALARSVHDGLDAVARTPSLRDPLAHWLGVKDVRFGASDVAGAGHVSLATFEATSPPSYQLGWLPGASDVRVALSESPAALLTPPLPGRSLSDDPAVRALVSKLGPAAAAVIAEPGKSPSCAGTPGGVVLAWGPKSAGDGRLGLWAQVAASDPALRCLAGAFF